jgi:hypothetical protein
MYRTRYTTLVVLVAVVGLGTVVPVGLAAYVGLRQPVSSRLSLAGEEANLLLTPLMYAPPGLERGFTPGEAALPHAAPWLVAPSPGAVYSESDASEVTFVWISAVGLDDDEEYVVQIWCSGPEGVASLECRTREKQLTLSSTDQMDCTDDLYYWRVTIYREGQAVTGEGSAGTPSSAPSDIRTLLWRPVVSHDSSR